MASNQFLVVCESFYSIQGEGASIGTPAVFLRLSGCNLRCNGFSYKLSETGEHLGCDSKQVWMQGQRRTFESIIEFWREQGWLDALNDGAHLVITGGEPLLQQVALTPFLQQLDNVLPGEVFVEIETNATIKATEALLNRVNQFNVSPKLSNSGESRDKAFQLDVLQQLVATQQSIFKFVIDKPEDVLEVVEHYVNALALARSRVWLMPEGGTQQVINRKKPWLIELCKQYRLNFTTRLQIDVWHEVVGV